MIRITSIALVAGMLLLTGCRKGSSGDSPTPQVEEFNISGIHVIHKMLAANSVVAVRLYINGGAATLTPKTAGIEGLYLAAMTSGTEKYDKLAFDALATTTGTFVGSSLDKAYSVATLRAVRDNFNESWDLFTQAVLHPTFPDSEVALSRQQIVFGLKQKVDDPDSHLRLVSDSVFYAGHPYAVEVDGTPESVEAMTRADLLAWQKSRLTKSNLLLVVVGNVSRAELEPKITEAFASLPTGTASSATVAAVPAGKPSLTTISEKIPTNYILGAAPGPARSHTDYPAFALANRILSERLFEEVRTKRNLSYAVDASVAPGRISQGVLYVTAVDPNTTLQVMLAEVKRMQDESVSAELIQEVLNVFVTSYWLNLETNMGQAEGLGNWELAGGGWKNALTFTDRVKAVSMADVQRVAKEYFRNYRFVVIGDPKKVDKALFTSM